MNQLPINGQQLLLLLFSSLFSLSLSLSLLTLTFSNVFRHVVVRYLCVVAVLVVSTSLWPRGGRQAGAGQQTSLEWMLREGRIFIIIQSQRGEECGLLRGLFASPALTAGVVICLPQQRDFLSLSLKRISCCCSLYNHKTKSTSLRKSILSCIYCYWLTVLYSVVLSCSCSSCVSTGSLAI